MTKQELILSHLAAPRTVKSLAAASGLSESVVRKALSALEQEGTVERHNCKPILFSAVQRITKPQNIITIPDVEQKGSVVLDAMRTKKALSVKQLVHRLNRAGIPVTAKQVVQECAALVASGQANRPYKRSQRYQRAA